MKNPPNKLDIIGIMTISFICALGGIYIFSNMDHATAMLVIGGALCLFASVALAIVIIFTQMIIRPIDVEVKDTISIRWRFNRIEELSIEDISDLILDPRAPNSRMTRWTAGSVGIKGRFTRFQLSYEIVIAIRDRYFERFGRYPPQPSWYERR